MRTLCLQGDAGFVASGGTLFGGNDTMDVIAAVVIGDVYESYGSLIGGADSISGSFFEAIGDARFADGLVVGGDDEIYGSSRAQILVGDVSDILGGTFRGGHDTLDGGGGDDRLYGDWESSSATSAQGGNDDLRGGAGRESVYGNAGNDLLRIYTGDLEDGEIYDGGTGHDTLNLDGNTVDLVSYSHDLRGVDLVSIEVLRLFDNGFGTTSEVKLNAAQFGGGIALDGTITVVPDTSSRDTVTIFMGGETWLDLSDMTVDGFTRRDDAIKFIGDADDETMTGTGANDWFVSGGGIDQLDGGGGINDTADYTGVTGAIGITLADGGGAATLVRITGSLRNVEHLVGGSGGDTLIGNAANNSLRGGSGTVADFLRGGAGRDTLDGGGGDDSLYIAEGEDASGESYIGGSGNDSIVAYGIDGSFSLDLRNDVLSSIEVLNLYGADAYENGTSVSATVKITAAQASGFSRYIGSSPTADTIEITMGTTKTLSLSGKTIDFLTGTSDRFVLLGDSDKESITGSSIRDSISASGGDDTLKGGLAAVGVAPFGA